MPPDRFSMLEFDDVPVAPVATPAPASDVTGDLHRTGPGGLTARAAGQVASARDLAAKADLAWSPVIQPLSTADGMTVPADVGRVVVRSDTRAPIGIVGKRYEAIDHGILFDLADAIRGETGGALTFGNAGHRQGGAKVFVQLDTAPETLTRGIEAGLKISLFTSHDGTICLTAGFSSTVVVCKNTYRHALRDCKDGLKIRHTAGASEIAADAKRIAEAAGAYAGSWGNAALAMMGRRLDDHGMRALASMLIPGESKRAENSRGDLMRAWTSSPGARPGTVFGAMQAVTHYTTHTIGREDVRAESLVFGTGTAAEMQASAWWTLDQTEDQIASKLAQVKLFRV